MTTHARYGSPQNETDGRTDGRRQAGRQAVTANRFIAKHTIVSLSQLPVIHLFYKWHFLIATFCALSTDPTLSAVAVV